MSYLVFARKFRPQKFKDVIGQEHVSTTLQNSIQTERVAQSFLFSGTRGVGKTSMARILAKVLNCTQSKDTEPCDQCPSCQEIIDGRSLDVLEIDGASNRGIEEIRNLRDTVKFKPAHAKYKIFIIDEVHMLTTEAFNALLKTLEEPPSHVKFIFATTELHKVPLTILSRCQKFVFSRVAANVIAEKLKEILSSEKIKHDEKGLFLIAKAAEGSLRDAETLLDQAASFGKGKVTYETVIDMLGAPKQEVYLSLIQAILQKDVRALLEIFQPISLEGSDMEQFAKGLHEWFRALLILKSTQQENSALLDMAAETQKELGKFLPSFSLEDLLSINQILQNLIVQVRRSPIPHLQVEATLIKLAHRENLLPLNDILRKLDALPAAAKPAASMPTAAAPRAYAPAAETSRPSAAPAPTVKKTEAPAVKNTAAPQMSVADSGGNTAVAQEIEPAWTQIVETVRNRKMSCGTYLAEAQLLESTADSITLGFPEELKFHKESLETAENKKLIQSVAAEILGRPARINLIITQSDSTATTAGGEPAKKKSDIPEIVESAMEIFNGRIIQK